jgi:hypothetical protein
MLGRFFKLFERKSGAYDALLGIGRTEIPQCSGLAPHRDVVAVQEGHS